MSTSSRLIVDNMTDQGFDPTAMFKAATFADEIIIQDRDDATVFQVWKMTAAAIVRVGFFEVPIEFVSFSGAAANFSNNQEIAVLLRTRGTAGPKGDTGPQGPQGITGESRTRWRAGTQG